MILFLMCIDDIIALMDDSDRDSSRAMSKRHYPPSLDLPNRFAKRQKTVKKEGSIRS